MAQKGITSKAFQDKIKVTVYLNKKVAAKLRRVENISQSLYTEYALVEAFKKEKEGK